jgi:catechol 2,3-dioxygenase-like lactoylglutathione lyase family enzyme
MPPPVPTWPVDESDVTTPRPRTSSPLLPVGTMRPVLRLHHVNLSIPVSGADAEAAFLVDYLDYERMDLMPGTPPQAKWFAGADGTQIHLSEDPDHHPSTRAHVAVEFGDSLAELRAKFDKTAYEYSASSGPNGAVLFCQDPAGNRWELRGTLAD